MDEDKRAVKAMIGQIRDRLIDLEEAIDRFEGPLEGYAQKLDRIDDKVYLLEEELERAMVVDEADTDRNSVQEGGNPPRGAADGAVQGGERAVVPLSSIGEQGHVTEKVQEPSKGKEALGRYADAAKRKLVDNEVFTADEAEDMQKAASTAAGQFKDIYADGKAIADELNETFGGLGSLFGPRGRRPFGR